MKFSVLLPTRNRLEFLKYAIASVLQQDEDDFEIIVSDNFSEEDIAGYIQSLNDKRIKYSRTDSFVSVTDNWNNALNKSSGEWVIMLGDDDCLMKGYFSTIRTLIEKFQDPDFIYTRGFIFAYPNVLPGHAQSVAHTAGDLHLLTNSSSVRWLLPEESYALVKETFNFKCHFSYNMQFAIINRRFIEKLKIKESFFHSPYPDYYAMTTMMLFGKNILSCPYPLVGVGISPKSFGYYYFNNIENNGVSFLNNNKEREIPKDLRDVILPGTDMNTSWLLSLEKIKENFSGCSFSINYKRYRLLQIVASLQPFLERKSAGASFKNLWKLLSVWEKPFIFPLYFVRYFPLFFRRKACVFLARVANSHFHFSRKYIQENFANIQLFFESIDPKAFVETNND